MSEPVHQSLLRWRNYRYLKWTLPLLVASCLVFVSQFQGMQPPSGATWQGYVLGISGALIVVWLSLLGIRKRRYYSRLGSVLGWASAHVYLGMLVLVLALLHSAMELSALNIHTATFWLLLIVVLSGFFGLYVYLHLPTRMSANLAGQPPDHWSDELHEVDRRIAVRAALLRGPPAAQVISALQGTAIGGTKLDQLLGRDHSRLWSTEKGRWLRNTDQQAIIAALSEAMPSARLAADQAETLSAVFALFGQRQQLLRRIRADIRYGALLRIWLYLHIPCTIALLIALAVHIFVMIYYW